MSSSQWKEIVLSEIATITMGQSPKGDFCNNNGVGTPLLNGPTEFGESHPFPTQFTVDVKKRAKKGDLLFCVRGSTAGRMNWADQDYAIGRGIAAISPKKENYGRFIRAAIEINLPLLLNMATGSTFPNISKNMLSELRIICPPSDEMAEVNNVIRSIEDKIQINNNINKKMEEMAQAIFKQWFVDFEFPNEEGKPYKSSGGLMVESELGMIPEGWEIGTLNKIVQLSTKSVNPQKSPELIFEHFSIPALDRGKIPELQLGADIKSSKYIINNDAVLISKLNPTTKRIWKPLPQTGNPVCSTEFIVFIPKDKNFSSFVYELINTDMFSEMLVSHATGSTGSRQRVKPRDTLNFKLVLPSDILMIRFSEMIKPLHDNVSIKVIENQKITRLRDTLLPKLMTGAIHVPLSKE